jgi:hypothetical protein
LHLPRPDAHHQLDQRPGRAEPRQAEIPLWQDANIRPPALKDLA